MADMIFETLSTPVLGSYDVIVCGGGVAGAAAAVASARHGMKVLLLEKGIQLGGLATAGLISWYEPLCDGRGNKLMYGMAAEMLKLAVRDGDDTLDPEWRKDPDHASCEKRFSGFFSHTAFTCALDGFAADAGVELLLDSVVVQPLTENGKTAGVIVENKTGRGAYRARFVIDATGDADIMARSGAPCAVGGNYLSFIGYRIDKSTIRKALESGNLLDARVWLNPGADLWGNRHPEGCPYYAGVTAEEVTQFVLRGRALFADAMRAYGRTEADCTVLPSMAQLRTTRRIEGAYTLTREDMGRHFDDSVTAAGDFAHRGECYEIPYRTLYCPGYRNLLTAGRTISSAGWAWDVTRVIPVAAATGQAAGTAAALCVEKQCAAEDLPVETLQTALSDDGVRLKL